MGHSEDEKTKEVAVADMLNQLRLILADVDRQIETENIDALFSSATIQIVTEIEKSSSASAKVIFGGNVDINSTNTSMIVIMVEPPGREVSATNSSIANDIIDALRVSVDTGTDYFKVAQISLSYEFSESIGGNLDGEYDFGIISFGASTGGTSSARSGMTLNFSRQ